MVENFLRLTSSAKSMFNKNQSVMFVLPCENVLMSQKS